MMQDTLHPFGIEGRSGGGFGCGSGGSVMSRTGSLEISLLISFSDGLYNVLDPCMIEFRHLS